MNTSPDERFDRIEAAMPYKPQSRALDPRDVVIAPTMYRLIMDPQIPRSELRIAAEPYGKARGL